MDNKLVALAEILTIEDEKRRLGKDFDRDLILKADKALYEIDMDLPERRRLFRTFKDLSESQKLYVAFIIN